MDWITVVFWLVGTLVALVGPIILAHELGHYIFARLAGVRVEEFGFGLPPRMLRLWRGKGYLEIGGVRVTIPVNFRVTPRARVGVRVDAIVRRQDDGSHILRRLRVIDADEEQKPAAVDDGLHLRGEVTALEPGTLYSLNWLPMGAFVKMTGEEDPSDPRSLAAQPKRWRIAVLAAGSLFNIVAALVLLIAAYTAGFPDRWLVKIGSVEPASAAAAAGVQPGDIVLSAGDVTIAGETLYMGMEQLRKVIRAAPEQTIEIVVLRGKETMVLMATPRRNAEGYGFLGIVMAPWPDRSAVHHYSPPEALRASSRDFASVIEALAQLPGRLLQGNITPQEARPTSIVGISQVLAFSLQQSIEWGLAFFALHDMAFISLALGLGNLLPLPALDGGRILFVLIEALRRRRMSAEREGLVHFVGLVILAGLMILVMIQDVVNPIIPWSWLK